MNQTASLRSPALLLYQLYNQSDQGNSNKTLLSPARFVELTECERVGVGRESHRHISESALETIGSTELAHVSMVIYRPIAKSDFQSPL